MEKVFLFIEEMCKFYKIDESHGLTHAKGTYARAQEIISKNSTISDDEKRMALYAAALHDVCDHKYTDVKDSSFKIMTWLIKNGWSSEDATSLIHIITTMSYSKLKIDSYRITGIENVPIYPDHGKWQRAYHIARHADLLEGYIVARCILYDRHIHPERTEDQHWLRAIELFNERVFKYVKDGWITMPEALEIVPGLEEEARRCLKDRSMFWKKLIE
jgi:hypothetical protein